MFFVVSSFGPLLRVVICGSYNVHPLSLGVPFFSHFVQLFSMRRPNHPSERTKLYQNIKQLFYRSIKRHNSVNKAKTFKSYGVCSIFKPVICQSLVHIQLLGRYSMHRNDIFPGDYIISSYTIG